MAAALLAVVLLAAAPANAVVLYSQEKALELAFPDADRLTSKTYILTEAQAEAVRKRSRADLPSEIIRIYTGWKGDEILGYAYIDVHTVRTLPEAFLVVLSPDGRIRSLRLLAFYEPPEYMPSEPWLEQFVGRQPGEKLRLRGEIDGIVGSTLTAYAVTDSVRRVQAFYAVLLGGGEAGPGAD